MPKLPIVALAAAMFLLGCGENRTYPQRAPYDAGAPDAAACLPNLDGKIESHELSFAGALGVSVKYLVSPAGVERPVDLVGVVDSRGVRKWAFGTDYADDQSLVITSSPIAGKWYQPSFPTGRFTAPYNSAGTLEAISTEDEGGVYLLGVASATPDPPEGKTLLVYDRPVVLYRFPLVVGAEWSTTANVENGVVNGLPYFGQDVYEMTVDATGELVLPQITLTQAMRVRTHLRITPAAGEPISTRSVSFLSECLGAVTTVRSRSNEPDVDFTTAAELVRLGF